MGHVKWTFDKPAEVFTQKTENFLLNVSIRIKDSIYSSKNTFSQNVPDEKIL